MRVVETKRKAVSVVMVMKRRVVIAAMGVEGVMVKMAVIIHHDSGGGDVIKMASPK